MSSTLSPSSRSGAQPVPAPRSQRKRRGMSPEMLGWLFMRLSGVLLVGLVLGHLFINLMVGEGIERVDWAFVAGKWSSPFWQFWDLSMLWLAQLHGTNGMRTLINDYATRDTTRMLLKAALYTATFVVLVLGTLTIFTFDPCMSGSTLDVCSQ